MVEPAFRDVSTTVDEKFRMVAAFEREFGNTVVGQGVVVVGYGNGLGIIVHRSCACVE